MNAPAVAAAPPHTFEDAKRAVVRILANLAALTEPDTYECPRCAKGPMCADHSGDARAAARYIEAADRVMEAQTRDEADAALIWAGGGD